MLATFVGAAGMAQFESPAALQDAGYADAVEPGAGLGSYGEALWWTAMVMTTMGSEYWPKTVEGRVLGWLLALYAFAVFGYLTATIASLFVEQDATRGSSDSDRADLRTEVAALRAQVARLSELLARQVPHDRQVPGSQVLGEPEGRRQA